jgi:hypothetical protein
MSVARLHISLWVSWVQLFTYLYEYYFFYLPFLSEYFYRHSTSIPFEVLTAQLTCAVFNNFAKHVFYLLNTVPLRLKHLQPLLHIYFTPSSSLFSLIIIAIMIKVSLR